MKPPPPADPAPRPPQLPSPATTPGSIQDEERFLVPFSATRAIKPPHLDWKHHVPAALLAASLFELVFFLACGENLQKILRFEPNKPYEVWRFFTYMLLHEDWSHLLLNIIMQLLFAYLLELRHSRLRVLTLYFSGGITGVLGASCFHPDLVIGASAGVYALLISHISDILMNIESVKHKVYKALCIVIIVISDAVVYNLIQFFSRDEPLISWGAHVFGGVSGFCLGFVLFKRDQHVGNKTRKVALFWAGAALYSTLMISLIVVSLQIKKCTPQTIIRTRYVYFC